MVPLSSDLTHGAQWFIVAAARKGSQNEDARQDHDWSWTFRILPKRHVTGKGRKIWAQEAFSRSCFLLCWYFLRMKTGGGNNLWSQSYSCQHHKKSRESLAAQRMAEAAPSRLTNLQYLVSNSFSIFNRDAAKQQHHA